MTPIQQRIEEYREWLADQGVHSVTNYPKIWAKFNELFPVEHTSEQPTMSDLIMDTVDILVDDGPTTQEKADNEWAKLCDASDRFYSNVPDETDNIYPKH